MFADGVYEVVRYYGGHALAMAMHVERLRKGLGALRIDLPGGAAAMAEVSDELIERNRTPDASVYWQITRGAATRDFRFPRGVEPTVLAIAYKQRPLLPGDPTPRLTAITHPDDRWRHCEIKAISLLPNVLASQAAVDAGADCAILLRDDSEVTEATSRSIFIVERGELVTHPLDGRILDSITRRIAIQLAHDHDVTVREEYFKVDRLLAADEVVAAGSTTEIAAVVSIDGRAIGAGETGKPGDLTNQLFDWYKQHVSEECSLPV